MNRFVIRSSVDYLSFRDIEHDYGCIKASTLASWACTGRYNFDTIITKVGRKSYVRRDRWEAFLDAHTPGIGTTPV